MSLNLTKVPAGIDNVERLKKVQQLRSKNGEVILPTRNSPKRRDELLDGGSLYWIIKGAIVARQAILDIREGQYQDGSRCAILVLDSEIKNTVAKQVRGHQGWRYAQSDNLPLDLTDKLLVTGESDLPPEMLKELQILGLI